MSSSVKCEIVREPPSPEQLDKLEQCKLAVKPRHLEVVSDCEFVLGSLVFECSDFPRIFGCLNFTDGKVNVESLLHLNLQVQNRVTDKCLHSFYSLLMSSFTHRSFAATMSQANLHFLLATVHRVTSDTALLIDTVYKDSPIEDWMTCFSSLQRISILTSILESEPGVKYYMQVIEEIVKQPLWIQRMIEDAINLRCGPLMYLATRTTQENINYIMGKLKITTNVSLLQQLFCSPSVMGKCVALLQILEVNDLLWQSINPGKIEDMIPTFYTILEWIFDKCVAIKNGTIAGFEWVKAQFRRTPEESNAFPMLKTELPETPDCVKAEAAELPISVKYVTKQNFVSQIMSKQVKPEGRFDPLLEDSEFQKVKTYSNSCFFDSIEEMCGKFSSNDYRDMVLALLHREEKQYIKWFTDRGADEHMANYYYNNLITDLVNGGPVDQTVLFPMERILNRSVYIVSVYTHKTVTLKTTGEKFSDEPLWIYHMPGHYIPGVPCKIGEVIGIDFQPITVNIVQGPMDFTTSYCIDNFKHKLIYEDHKDYQPPVWTTIPFTTWSPKSKPKEDIVSQTSGQAVQVHVSEAEATKVVSDLECTETGRTFLQWLKNCVGDVYQFFKQNAIIGGIIAFVFSISSALGLGITKLKTVGDKRSFWEAMSGASRDFYYLSRGQDAFVKVFSDFGSIFRDMLGIDEAPEITQFKTNLLKAAEEAEAMNTLCNHSPGKVVNDPQKLVELKRSIDVVRKSYYDIARYTPTTNLAGLAPIWTRLNNAYTGLESHYGYFVNQPARRVRPACIWFWGKSNIGKSEFAQHFINELNKRMGTDWSVFTVSKGPDYLNGFKQQKIMLIDDFDSFKMQEGCLDALLVLNMVTSAPYNPNIAQLEEKGIQANPALIIICSNFQTASLNSGVNDMLAFERRRDFLINVQWNGGHEKCDASNTDCEHWKPIKEKAKETKTLSFDHLEMIRDHPLVYSNTDIFENPPPVVNKNAKADKIKHTKIRVLGPMSFESLLVETLAKIEEYKIAKEANDLAAAEVTRVAKEKQSVRAEASIDSWSKTNNVLLRGVPGIGKSVLLSKIKQKSEKKITYIETLVDFDRYAKDDWRCEGSEMVLFDDFTTFRYSDHCKRFWTLWKERADLGDAKLPIWVLGLNENVAIDYFPTLEDFTVHTRDGRASSFYFEFRKKPSTGMLTYFFPQCYTPDDLSDNTISYDMKVRISIGKEEIMSDQAMLNISKWEAVRKSEFSQDRLHEFTHLEIDAIAEIGISSQEFLKMINATGQAVKCMDLITTSTYKSKKLSKIEMGKRLASTFYEMRCLRNCNFSSMDDFILCGSNSGFFRRFNDGNYVMTFTDRSYCLVSYGSKVVAGLYSTKYHVENLGNLVYSVADTINTFDFLTVCRSTLPPWFCVAMSAVEQVVKTTLTAISIPQVIKQNKLMFKGMQMDSAVTKVTDQYVDKSLDEISVNQKNALLGESIQTCPLIVEKKKELSVISETDTSSSSSSTHSSSGHKKFRMRMSKARGRRSGKGHAKAKPHYEVKDNDPTEALEDSVLVYDEQKVIPEIAQDDAVFPVMQSIYTNLVDIQDLAGNHIVSGIMIAGRTGTTVGHLSKLKKPSELKVVDYKGNRYNMIFKDFDEKCDRLDFTIDSTILFKNIRKHICDVNSDYFEQRVAILINVQFKNNVPMLMARFFRVKESRRIMLGDYYHVDAFVYSSALSGFKSELPPQTTNGDCGGIVLVCDSQCPKKIIGMHIGSSNDSAYFRPLTSVMYPSTINLEAADFSGPFGEFMKPYYPEKDGKEIVARATDAPFIPDKTKLYRSPFAYGICDFEPSVLCKNDPRSNVEDLIFQESMKWTREPMCLDKRMVEQINFRMRMLGDFIGQKLKAFGVRTSKLTKQSALNAVRGYSHSKPINIGTSAGYPFNVGAKGKTDLIEIHPLSGERSFTKNVEIKQMFHKAIDHVLRTAQSGELAQVAFTIFPKDELLRKDKLKIKTRTIAASPIHLTVALRMYFHSINAAIADLWHIVPIKNGIAPNSTDWHVLSTWLLEVGDEGFSLDQQDFDFNMHPEINRAVVEFDNAICQLTDPKWTYEDDIFRSNLRENVVQFLMLVNSLVYRAKIGVPSGQPHTTPDNSKISLFLLYDAFCDLAPSWFEVKVDTFFKVVRSAIVGDDILAIVNKMILTWFNGKTVPEHLNKKYGLVFTPSDKGKEFYVSKPLSELDFLSRNFLKTDIGWLGPLKMQRLVKPLHFCHGSRSHHWFKEQEELTDEGETAVQAASSALQEMFFHGEEQYERLRKHILNVISDKLCISEAYFPPYEAEMSSYFDIPNYLEKGLYEYSFPLMHDIVPLLTRSQGWIKYSNRRCLIFGNYQWDSKSQNKGQKIPSFLTTVIDKLNESLCTQFNSILVNEYPPNGYIPWHKDNEEGLDQEEGVACVTLIGDGFMQWAYKEKDKYNVYMKMQCYPGHAYHMCGKYVKEMYHQRVKHTKYTITLTFRRVSSSVQPSLNH